MPKERKKFRRGTQIIYIPTHANENTRHPDVEFGFITSVDGEYAFCRYWHRGRPGDLRNKSVSERTAITDLKIYQSVPQSVVTGMLRWIENGEK